MPLPLQAERRHGRRASKRILALAGDERLVDEIRAGNESAFEVAFERHGRGVLSFCRHMLGSPEEAEEAVQHTFAAAWSDLQRNERPIRLKPWLYTIARNRCLSLLRSAPGERRPTSTTRSSLPAYPTRWSAAPTCGRCWPTCASCRTSSAPRSSSPSSGSLARGHRRGGRPKGGRREGDRLPRPLDARRLAGGARDAVRGDPRAALRSARRGAPPAHATPSPPALRRAAASSASR